MENIITEIYSISPDVIGIIAGGVITILFGLLALFYKKYLPSAVIAQETIDDFEQKAQELNKSNVEKAKVEEIASNMNTISSDNEVNGLTRKEFADKNRVTELTSGVEIDKEKLVKKETQKEQKLASKKLLVQKPDVIKKKPGRPPKNKSNLGVIVIFFMLSGLISSCSLLESVGIKAVNSIADDIYFSFKKETSNTPIDSLIIKYPVQYWEASPATLPDTITAKIHLILKDYVSKGGIIEPYKIDLPNCEYWELNLYSKVLREISIKDSIVYFYRKM